MSILIVDDSANNLLLLRTYLSRAGYKDITEARTASAAYELLGLYKSPIPEPRFDLILMDVMMPDISGIEACSTIKGHPTFEDLPIVMVTAVNETESLEAAFAAGAVDYITKPVNKVELLARMGTIIKLKMEMDRRKSREQELVELTKTLEKYNRQLEKISSQDALTGVANRRTFEAALEREWRIGVRKGQPLAAIMLDVDFFKLYNDTYGHQAGDDCLIRVALAMQEEIRRPTDLVARYGGEEFVILLPDTDAHGALVVAEATKARLTELAIPHCLSKVAPHVTASMGVASLIPDDGLNRAKIIGRADAALYEAKRSGRNRIKLSK